MYALGYCLGVMALISIVVAIVNAVNKNKEMVRHEVFYFYSTKPNCIATLVSCIILFFSSFTQFFVNEGAAPIVIAVVFVLLGALGATAVVKMKSFNE